MFSGEMVMGLLGVFFLVVLCFSAFSGVRQKVGNAGSKDPGQNKNPTEGFSWESMNPMPKDKGKGGSGGGGGGGGAA